MNLASLRILAAGVACLAASGAHALDSPTVWNNAHYPAAVTVRYAACKSDTFTVPARNIQGIGKATASANRGQCLITSVEATLNGKDYKVAAYSSPGAQHSQFMIRYIGGNPPYKIVADKDMGSNQFGAEQLNDKSPEGSLATAATARQAMSTDPLPACQKDNQASIRQLQARIAGAPAGKLTKAQKDHYEKIRTSLAPIPGQKGTIENCRNKTTTIASWKAEVDKALGTTM